MSLEEIIKQAKTKVEEMGGNEQFIGDMHELAATCGAKTEDEVFDWMVDLGEGLDKKGLQLISGVNRPQSLYAKPKAD